MPLRRKQDEDRDAAQGTQEGNDRPPIRFGVATVFDVSKTDPLPGVEPAPLHLPSQPITGDSHAHLIDAFTDAAVPRGYSVSYVEDLPVDGCTHKGNGLIKLRTGMGLNRAVAVLIHELAHLLVGRGGLSRAAEEVAVESAAVVVAAAAGLDCSSESVPYVAGWAGDEDPIAAVNVAAKVIDEVADELQAVLEDTGSDPEPIAPEARELSRAA